MKSILVCMVLLACYLPSFSQSNYAIRKASLKQEGYAICDEYSIRLAQGEQGSLYRVCHPGNDYKIIAFTTDGDVQDIDLYIYDDDGSSYTQDNDRTALCIVNFSPLRSRRFKFVVKNYSSETPKYESWCYLLIGCK